MKKSAGRFILASGFLLFALLLLGLKIEFPTSSRAEPHWQESSRSATAPAPGIDLQALNQAFTGLAERLSPSVVNIYTRTKVHADLPDEMFHFFFGNPFGDRFGVIPMEREAQSLGSGFIINDKGFIVTNTHVVRHAGRNADEIMVKFLKQDQGNGYPAEVVGVDERTDVALLKLKSPMSQLTVAPLGDSDKAKVGEWVIAIGNPYGHAHTVTQGIVSALGRSLENVQTEFIQTSASINPGNSGGPLFNLHGEVIGINTAIDPRAQGIGFAIPINLAKTVVKDLIEEGRVRRGYIGIMMTSLSPEISEALGIEPNKGVIVRQVIENGPAAKAGIRKGDIIIKVGGETITHAGKLVSTVTSLKAGQVVPFEILREAKPITLKVTIGEEPKAEPKPVYSRMRDYFKREG